MVPAFFQKAGGVLRGKAPESPDPEGETPQMIPKDQEGQPKRPGGTFGRRGTLSRGSPQDAVLQKRTFLEETAPREKRTTFLLAGAVFRFGLVRSGLCRNFFEIAAAGTSAGGLRAAFPYFWVAPEAQRVGFRFLRKARRGAAPPPCQPFEKGWIENFIGLCCGISVRNSDNLRCTLCI